MRQSLRSPSRFQSNAWMASAYHRVRCLLPRHRRRRGRRLRVRLLSDDQPRDARLLRGRRGRARRLLRWPRQRLRRRARRGSDTSNDPNNCGGCAASWEDDGDNPYVLDAPLAVMECHDGECVRGLRGRLLRHRPRRAGERVPAAIPTRPPAVSRSATAATTTVTVTSTRTRTSKARAWPAATTRALARGRHGLPLRPHGLRRRGPTGARDLRWSRQRL